MANEWGEGLARQVIVEAVYGRLIRALPGAFTADLFGEPTTPRARIAKVIQTYVAERGVRPDPGVLDTLIEREVESRPEAEREAIAEEWAMIQDTDASDDPGYIEGEVRDWIMYQRTTRAIEEAADAMGQTGGATKAQEIMAGIEPVRAADENRVLKFRSDVGERMALWSEGVPMGEKIATGMRGLDEATNGGPSRKECWYFLAPPKGGKTTFLLNVARNAMIRGKNVYVNTFEMQALRMMLRLDQMVSKTGKRELMGDGDMQMANLTRLRTAIQGLNVVRAGEILVSARSTQQKASVAAVKSDIKRLRDEGTPIDLVIFDYLNIMGAAKDERELRHVLFNISYELADMAKELDVVIWSAALANRQAVDKVPIRKNDIAESFGVIGAVDGAIAICSPPVLVEANLRRLWIAAAREEGDERSAGDYRVNFDTMTITSLPDGSMVDELLAQARRRKKSDDA